MWLRGVQLRGENRGAQGKGILESQWEEAQTPLVGGWTRLGPPSVAYVLGVGVALPSSHFPDDSDGHHGSRIRGAFLYFLNSSLGFS